MAVFERIKLLRLKNTLCRGIVYSKLAITICYSILK